MAERDPGERRTRGSANAHELLGRDAEIATIRDDLTYGNRMVTVLGVAGAGKSAVLAAVAASAAHDGWVVLRVQGRATETMLGFATLLDLLESRVPQDAETGGLAASIRERLMGSAEGGTPEALRLRRDVHQWLVGLASEGDVLVEVDDVQWVDPASWSVLAFVANRLGQSQVSFLLASRADAAPVGLDDLPVLHLSPLGPTDAAALLEQSGPALDPVVRSSIVGRAAGNPLALLELGRLSSTVTAGASATHDTIPATIEAAFAADLPGLPASTRDLLLLVAAGADDLTVLSQAAERSETVAELLEPAERAGLVRVRRHRVVFRHPLIESTVYGLASAAQRRDAHAVLAEAYAGDDDRRVWHRAAATDRPDEAVAAELMASADRMLMRGAQQEAADAVMRAAELTLDPDLRDERILAGVDMSPAVGHVHKMATLAEHFRRSSTHPLVRARSAQLHAYALAQTMRQTSARDMLHHSLEELIELDDEAGWASLTTLATLTYRTGRGRDALAGWLERYDARTPHDLDDHPLNAAARAWIRAAMDPLARPADLRLLLRTAPEQLSGEWPAHSVAVYDTLLGATAWLLDEHPTAQHRLTRAADTMLRTGATQQLAQTVMALGQVQFDLGLYDDADRSGRLLVDIGEAQGLVYHRTVGRELRARVAAVRADHREALKQIDALLAETEPRQSASLEAILITGRAYALVGLLDHEGAYQELRSLFDADGAPLHPHVSYLALGDLAAAAVRVGRVDEVAHLVLGAGEQVPDLPGQRLARVLARARAQLADDSEAEPFFERAVHEAGAATWPFEWANAQLEYGVWLRRQRRSADARHHLRSAHQVFSRLGTSSWATAAEAELRAAGVRLDDHDQQVARWGDLTAQEREIVLLAATGLSNKEIGQTLFLSPRTVGAHLYHAFPKLGVTSRTQLRDVVDRLHAS